MTMTDHDLYFEWLVGRIDNGRSHDYSMVLLELFHTIFTYDLPRDVNRASDGTDLRYIYAEEIGAEPGFWSDFLPVECTMLEMMVALAIRWDDSYMYSYDSGARPQEWFWMMIKNTGLSSFSNNYFNKNEVDVIIEKIVKREYGRDGSGGLFITKDPKIDMRTEEIWYQLSYFIDDFLG